MFQKLDTMNPWNNMEYQGPLEKITSHHRTIFFNFVWLALVEDRFTTEQRDFILNFKHNVLRNQRPSNTMKLWFNWAPLSNEKRIKYVFMRERGNEQWIKEEMIRADDFCAVFHSSSSWMLLCLCTPFHIKCQHVQRCRPDRLPVGDIQPN